MSQRHSIKKIGLSTNSKCGRVYPVKAKPDGSLGTTIGFKLTADQAVGLATRLLLAATKWSDMDLTVFRPSQSITITAVVEDDTDALT